MTSISDTPSSEDELDTKDSPRHFVIVKVEDPRLSHPPNLEGLFKKRTDKELKEAGLPFYPIDTPIEGWFWTCAPTVPDKHRQEETIPFKVGRPPQCSHELPEGPCGSYMYPHWRGYNSPISPKSPNRLYVCRPEESDTYRSCGYRSLVRLDYEEEPPKKTICLGYGRKSFEGVAGPKSNIKHLPQSFGTNDT
ncbi:hypothetical protein HYFRA_00013362 [Hymenoscyphus fraxineus]|uniref:Uncharacterized protein n=1 Tax=Hymenoscyphus fraxineus TaxID=746836 RepID=A0A9N9PNY9_9HELO|nr:hypothetical protein HYFRA_00013362 [Hymenoscyphus fraxineus]